MNTPETVIGYLPVGDTEEKSNFGDKHKVEYYKEVPLTPTGHTLPYDNGYERTDQPTYLTPAGRIYQRQISWDYNARPHFRPLNGDGPTLDTKASVSTHSRNIDGFPLTPNTPAGEPLSVLVAEGRISLRPAFVVPATDLDI
ncbi:hypothetical protein [Aeromicrobium sp. 179-A 4D2 NHS]|uniref:hypothetical protein n=1 Tax=Aeromicrobium sp. 179-A 4D2 NHS TaxID=3142375 RepID=UPI0039A2F15A